MPKKCYYYKGVRKVYIVEMFKEYINVSDYSRVTTNSFFRGRTEEQMNNKIKIGVGYILRIKAGGQNLTYTGSIISYDERWLFLKDKFNKTLIFPIHSIISLEEQESGE